MFSSLLLFQIAILKGNLLEIPRAKDLKEGHAFFLHEFPQFFHITKTRKSKQKSGKKGRKLRRALNYKNIKLSIKQKLVRNCMLRLPFRERES